MSVSCNRFCTDFLKGFLQEAFFYHFPVFLQCCTTSLFGLQTFQFKQLLEAKLIRPAEGSWDQGFINIKGNKQCETFVCMLLLVIWFFICMKWKMLWVKILATVSIIGELLRYGRTLLENLQTHHISEECPCCSSVLAVWETDCKEARIGGGIPKRRVPHEYILKILKEHGKTCVFFLWMYLSS